ncbi:nicotinate phosphoribosyltransferase [Candidatus Woesearchaeota archaeon]|nr:nicotinate phosphoribosyltransferase [Candidatus Woesearchaeota archaeon]
MNQEKPNKTILTDPYQTIMPKNYQAYVDKYFLRTKEVLEKEELDQIVKLKVFARKGNTFAGGEEASYFLQQTLKKEDPDSHLWVLPEGAKYSPKEPLMIIEGKAAQIVEKETIYLGILSGALSKKHGIKPPTYEDVYERAKELVSIMKDIPITYFGARHYHWSLDEMISRAALDAGFKSASSDNGAATHGMKGVGTMPHFLIVCMASKYGMENATAEATKAFDKHISQEVPRVVLIDTFNREISDSIASAEALQGRLNSVRIDTCGENIGEGGTAYTGNNGKDPDYKTGTGVTIELAQNLREALDKAGHDYVNIFLSSGFGEPRKAEAFVRANDEWKQKHKNKLFSGVGIGEITPAIFTTADIFEVDGMKLSKVGREVEEVDYSKLKNIF